MGGTFATLVVFTCSVGGTLPFLLLLTFSIMKSSSSSNKISSPGSTCMGGTFATLVVTACSSSKNSFLSEVASEGRILSCSLKTSTLMPDE